MEVKVKTVYHISTLLEKDLIMKLPVDLDNGDHDLDNGDLDLAVHLPPFDLGDLHVCPMTLTFTKVLGL